MSVYMKRFVFMSLFYLGLAAVFGILTGTTDIGYAGTFAHTHFNLLGFMAMIVFGIGYFILPRFNGTDLRWPGWVPVHFWLGNISLVGMVTFRGLQSYTGAAAWEVLFILMASLQVLSLFLFIVNIWVTLLPGKTTASSSEPKREAVTVAPDSRIADLIERAPGLQQVLVDEGLKMLAVPGHLDKVRKVGVTLEMAASNHGLDLDRLITAVEAGLSNGAGSAPGPAAGRAVFTPETLIGNVMKDYPKTRVVFERYFGDGCFECPGQAYESIDMACRMHGVDPDLFMEELHAAAAEEPATS